MAGLVSAAVVSGSVAAYALSAGPQATDATAPAPTQSTRSISCVEQATPDATAYFTVRYRADARTRVAAIEVCDRAHTVLAHDAERLRALSPDEARGAAADLVAPAAPRADAVTVDAASFGPVGDDPIRDAAACLRTDGGLVVLVGSAHVEPVQRSLWCTRAGLRPAPAGADG
ncbi:hypothetical protein [Microbacterium luticocti]|uniref:hypothetical protein n=1 Tax=Microbacterium luticocti TaxID=451764 RepID=UPI0004035F0D|nr:hypothetical protein [Microbacterium luticocti]